MPARFYLGKPPYRMWLQICEEPRVGSQAAAGPLRHINREEPECRTRLIKP